MPACQMGSTDEAEGDDVASCICCVIGGQRTGVGRDIEVGFGRVSRAGRVVIGGYSSSGCDVGRERRVVAQYPSYYM